MTQLDCQLLVCLPVVSTATLASLLVDLTVLHQVIPWKEVKTQQIEEKNVRPTEEDSSLKNKLSKNVSEVVNEVVVAGVVVEVFIIQ